MMIGKIRKVFSMDVIILLFISIALSVVGHFSDQIEGLFLKYLSIGKDISEVVFVKLNSFALFSFVSSVILIVIRWIFYKFWMDYVEPSMSEHMKTLDREFKGLRKETVNLIGAAKIDAVIENSPPDVVRERLPKIFERSFGRHCQSDKGLYKAMQDRVGVFFDQERPHRSGLNLNVVVRENGDGSITWHETCRYQLHTICFDPDYQDSERSSRGEVDYDVHYGSSSKIPGLDTEDDLKKLNVIVRLNKEEIFDSSKHLSIEPETGNIISENESVNVLRRDDLLEVSLLKSIKIKDAWTQIEIEERSIINDDFFICRRGEPTCGANITITLPEGWSFDYFSFGNKESWNYSQNPVNTLHATNSGWVMPGIMFFCKWQKPEHTAQ